MEAATTSFLAQLAPGNPGAERQTHANAQPSAREICESDVPSVLSRYRARYRKAEAVSRLRERSKR
jgi:hypothetical protein